MFFRLRHLRKSARVATPILLDAVEEAPRLAQTQTEMSNTIELSQFRTHENDTGGSAVQIAKLTQRIVHLTDHMSRNKKDFSSRRGLLMLVAKRRRLLDYLKRTDEERYRKLLQELNLRR